MLIHFDALLILQLQGHTYLQSHSLVLLSGIQMRLDLASAAMKT